MVRFGSSCLMASDAKSILGTIYKVRLSLNIYIVIHRSGILTALLGCCYTMTLPLVGTRFTTRFTSRPIIMQNLHGDAVAFLLFSSAQDGFVAFGRTHSVITRSTPSLRRFPRPGVVFETVRVLAWLTMAPSRPFKANRPALQYSRSLFLRLSLPSVPHPEDS